ncbi:MAG: PilZ domain-containing protein, partial [Desulfuromonadales bacterium]|nr:PilZ domain-containing protein [Desulfuromonadales bacterium]
DFLTKPLDRRLFLEKGHQFLVSIDRREQRRNCKLPVRFSCRGKSVQGHCLDLSSGGMFLDCVPEARKGDRLWLNFILPDAESTGIEVYGRVAWVNNDEQIIKDDYPYGYGVEFVDIPEETGVALRRHFGI